MSRIYSATFVNVRCLVLTFTRDTSVPFDESERLSLPGFRVALFFCLVGFYTGFSPGGFNISKVRVVLNMKYYLVRLANVPISSNVNKIFNLRFKLLFH